MKKQMKVTANKKNYLRHAQWVIFMFIFNPHPVCAATIVSTIVRNGTDWLSGEIAGCLAIIFVIYSGYECMGGRLQLQTVALRVIGIGIVIGGSTICSKFLSGTSVSF